MWPDLDGLGHAETPNSSSPKSTMLRANCLDMIEQQGRIGELRSVSWKQSSVQYISSLIGSSEWQY